MLEVGDVIIITDERIILKNSDNFYKRFKIPFIKKREMKCHINITSFTVKAMKNIVTGVSVAHLHSIAYNLDIVVFDEPNGYENSLPKTNDSDRYKPKENKDTSNSSSNLPVVLPKYTINEFLEEFELEY